MNEFLFKNLAETKSYSFPTAALALWVLGSWRDFVDALGKSLSNAEKKFFTLELA